MPVAEVNRSEPVVLGAVGIFAQYWLKPGVRTVASAAPVAASDPAEPT